MTTNMITAARLIGHKSINGKYQTNLAMDKFPVLGHQMTIDSFITDSANSASALNTGHKSTVNCLNVYADSSPNSFDDPKVETIAEMFHRLTGVRNVYVRTACETNTDFIYVHLGTHWYRLDCLHCGCDSCSACCSHSQPCPVRRHCGPDS
jgi:hypothetical protein